MKIDPPILFPHTQTGGLVPRQRPDTKERASSVTWAGTTNCWGRDMDTCQVSLARDTLHKSLFRCLESVRSYRKCKMSHYQTSCFPCTNLTLGLSDSLFTSSHTVEYWLCKFSFRLCSKAKSSSFFFGLSEETK